jgi:hypothetical protein
MLPDVFALKLFSSSHNYLLAVIKKRTFKTVRFFCAVFNRYLLPQTFTNTFDPYLSHLR